MGDKGPESHMGRSDSTFIAIGGGGQTEDTLDALFAPLEKVRDPRVAVMTVASNTENGMTSVYNSMFRKRGVKHVSIVNVSTRDDAFDKPSLKKIENADLIYFTGGDQLNVTSLFGGSPLHELLWKRVKEGVAIGGTSAGAAMMSTTMVNGGESDTGPKKGAVEIAPGLDLIENTIIDTHFSERGRYGRLLTAVAHYPQILGIGLDESTGIVVKGNKFRVVGAGSVIVIDGGSMSYADLVYRRDGKPIGMVDVTLHALCAGFSFDLKTRTVTAPRNSTSAAG